MNSNGRRCVSFCILAVFLLAMASGAIWQPYDPHAINIPDALSIPSFKHWLGTDNLGRDVASRLLAGSHSSLIAIAIVLCGNLVIGLSAGMVIAFGPRLLSAFVRWLAVATLAIPTLIMALLLAALFGAGVYTIAIALIISAWAPYAISIAALLDRLRNEHFWQASLALGSTIPQSLVRHMLPNTWPIIGALAGADAGRAVILVSSLGFLGLSADTGRPEWGAMIYEYRMFLFSEPRLVLAPVFATALVSLMLNRALDNS